MVSGGGGGFYGDQTTKYLYRRKKLYHMIYKRYVKGNIKFTTYNPMGTTIGQDMKIATKIVKKIK